MKVKAVLGVMGVALCVGATAKAEEAAPAVTDGSFGVDVVSAYVFRGATITDEVNVQPALGGTFYGIELGTWATLNTDASQFEEVDFTVGYALPLGELPLGFGLAVGYTEYTYPTAVDEEGAGLEADREVSLSASLDTLLAPSLLVAYGLEGPFLDDGLHVALGLEHEVAVTDGIGLTAGATLAYEDGDNFAESGFSYAQLSLSSGIGPFGIGVDYIIETDEDVLVVDEDVIGKLSFSLPL